MPATPNRPKQQLIDTLDEQWSSIASLLRPLGPGDWARPSPLPGWSVHDVVAHMIGTESALSGEQTPLDEEDVSDVPHVRNKLGERNERWVRSMRADRPDRMITRFEQITKARLAALSALSQADFDAPSWTPLGPGTYGDFMQLRVFDCWAHEQDIRTAVGRPGHESGRCPELVVDAIEDRLATIVGKAVDPPGGSGITLALTGPVIREMHVLVDGGAAVVDRLPGPATTTVRLPSTLCILLVSGRVDPDDHSGSIDVTGDTELGDRLVRNLTTTP